MKRKMKFTHKIVLLALLAVAITSCGGNSGNKRANSVIYKADIKFASNHGSVSKGEVSNGVVVSSGAPLVGIIDSGFRDTHDGRVIISNSESDEYYTLGGYGKSHGDLVNNVIANLSNSALVYAINGAKYKDGSTTIAITTQMYTALEAAGVAIINHSFGEENTSTPITELTSEQKKWAVWYKQLIDAGVLFVWAAGNDGLDNPHCDAQIPTIETGLEKGWVVVTAVDSEGNLTKYSSGGPNKAGNCKNFTIAAIDRYDFNKRAAGTSFATPAVTAAAAEVKKTYPWMTGDLLRQTILSTANKPGTETVTTDPDETTGWGVLNATRALSGPARFDSRLTFDVDESNNPVVTVDTKGYTDKEYTFGNDITGNAGLLKTGTGTLVLSGNNSYTGATTISGGTLKVTNKITSDVTTASGGEFILAGTTQATNITNNGKMSVTGGTATITSLTGKGELCIEADTDGKITATGTIDISNHSRISVYFADPTNVQTTSKTQTIATAATLTPPTTLDVKSESVYVDVDSSSGAGNKLDVTYKRNSTPVALAHALAAIPASLSDVGENLDATLDGLSAGREVSAEFRAAAAGVMKTEAAALPVALASMTGEIYATSQNLTFDQQKDISRALSHRMYGMLTDHTLMGEAWFDILGSQGKIEKSGYASADTEMYGAQVGIQAPMTTKFSGGVSVAATRAQLDFGGNTGKSDATSIVTSMYSVYMPAEVGYYVMGKASLGTVQTDVNRQVYNGSEYVSEDTNRKDRIYSLYGEIGYRFPISEYTHLSPFVGFAFDSVTRGRITETSPFGIVANSHSYDQTSGVIGLRADMKLNDKLAIKGDITYYSSSTQELAIKGHWAGDRGEDKVFKGIGLAKDTTWVGFGAEYKANENLSFDLTYNYRTAHSKSHLGTVGFKYRF